ncbi:uncharacterized protein LOC101752618 isoform X1 [Setaria italica]|uniref:uncharacterized protein LOC101752618 isoform X1 n=1 Tax=Setaria italica TaxID=4555 RepID=UPI000350AEB4|nr:uncharacterized protein LOC101752618 isoform X1 [Setaria italica]
MAAEGPKKAEAPAAKDVAEGKAVVPAPGPPAGDSKALVVVDKVSTSSSEVSSLLSVDASPSKAIVHIPSLMPASVMKQSPSVFFLGVSSSKSESLESDEPPETYCPREDNKTFAALATCLSEYFCPPFFHCLSFFFFLSLNFSWRLEELLPCSKDLCLFGQSAAKCPRSPQLKQPSERLLLRLLSYTRLNLLESSTS